MSEPQNPAAEDPDLDDGDIETGGQDAGSSRLEILLSAEHVGRLDKVLSEQLEGVSRARLQALMAEGHLTRQGMVLSSLSQKASPGLYELRLPAPLPDHPQPQSLPLSILFEDQHLIVLDKAAGMAVHPAPGTLDGTLVNALLHHCGNSLSGIGGVARPGIVHRLDKDTSGVMVVAKSDAAHRGLSALFARHDLDRLYVALVRGAPKPQSGTLTTRIGRSPSDRKKMAVLPSGGREAVTHYRCVDLFGSGRAPVAAQVECRLETGRTHQIRVHMASLGAPCLADPVYGGGQPVRAVSEAVAQAGLARQALHAAVLGFVHPVTQASLRFETPLPDDMSRLLQRLETL